MNYIVEYDGWQINVVAGSIKQARHRAWLKFNEIYSTPYGKFMSGITDVSIDD
jgi:hypothetical protein|nr:MAG TPA: hypothetical protein [Caudoviricetes sp.]